MRTIGTRLPPDLPSGDFKAECDYCGVPWYRSQLTLDGAGNLRCPDEGDGLDQVTLELENAIAVQSRPRQRAPRDGVTPRQPLDTLGALGNDLLHRWEVPKAGSSDITIADSGEVQQLNDTEGSSHAAHTSYADDDACLYSSSGGANGQPYIYQSSPKTLSRGTIYDATLSKFKNNERLGIYCVCKPANGGNPAILYDASVPQTRWSAYATGGNYGQYMRPTSSILCTASHGAVDGEWHLFSCEARASGVVLKLDGTESSPGTSTKLPITTNGTLSAIIGTIHPDDQFGALYVIRNPDDTKDAIMRAYTLAKYGLE